MEPTKYDLDKVKKSEVRRYSPGNHLHIVEWFCESCQERIGFPYMDDTHAKICDVPAECPHSVDWDGDACGHVVCCWCHEPATERIIKWNDPDAVETIAGIIGLDEPVSFL